MVVESLPIGSIVLSLRHLIRGHTISEKIHWRRDADKS